MTTLKERHLFPGGNTSKGFYSFYRYILSQDDANRIFCIKGGPGTGKSTLMKKIGKHFSNKGYTIEYHHCSSDNDSLDAVVIKELNIALLDGTSPHIVDPINPGAVDEILNLGEAINTSKISKHKNDIIQVNKEISKNFKRAYRFLRAAKCVHDDWSSLNYESLNSKKISFLMDELSKLIPNTPAKLSSGDRNLFATAFTPSGIISYIDELTSDFNTKVILNGGPGLGKSSILRYIGSLAEKQGFFVEYLHDPLSPERLEHILIPEISTCVLTENEINQSTFTGLHYNMTDYTNQNTLNNNASDIKFIKTEFYALVNKALDLIHNAHLLHDDLETYYINNIDFNKLDNIYLDVINRIESYE